LAVRAGQWLLKEQRAGRLVARDTAPSTPAATDPGTGMTDVDLNLDLGLDEPPSTPPA
jgi:hypothetical protein